MRLENSRLHQELKQKSDSYMALKSRLDHLESCLQASANNNNNNNCKGDRDCGNDKKSGMSIVAKKYDAYLRPLASIDDSVTVAGKSQLLAPINRFRANGTLSRKASVNRRTGRLEEEAFKCHVHFACRRSLPLESDYAHLQRSRLEHALR